MIKNDEPTSKGLRVVLIPVVVGSLLGLFASLSTTAYTTWATQKETIRKERLSHLEQAMTLCSRYSNDLARAVGVGLLTKGKADAALVASMVHYGDYRISELKTYLHGRDIKMRMNW